MLSINDPTPYPEPSSPPLPKYVKRDFETEGYAVIRGLFSEDDLAEVHGALLDRYSRYFQFGASGSLAERVQAARLLDDSAQTRVDDLRPLVRRLARESAQFTELFTRVLEPQEPENLELSQFCDFRINVPRAARLRKPTAWHQDIQTDYCYFPEQMKSASATCWVAVSRARTTNSIEIIPRSHQPRRIYGQDFRNHHFDPMRLRESVLWEEPIAIEAECGDVVVMDQFLWHRSVANSSGETRFSFDVRFLDTSRPVDRFEADLRLLAFRFANYGYSAVKRVFQPAQNG